MAFSLASMADAAVEGIRDAAAIVKSYQNTDENKARLKEFLGRDLDGTETGGAKKKSLKGFLKGNKKLNQKFGRALGKMKSNGSEQKQLRKSKNGGCAYKFGDGDGSYWDRWLAPARAPKYALPVEGKAARSHVDPVSGWKKDLEAARKAKKDRREKEREVENKMLEDHINYAVKNLGHTLHESKLMALFEEKKKNKPKIQKTDATDVNLVSRRGSLSPSDKHDAIDLSHEGIISGDPKHSPKAQERFYNSYHHFETHVQQEPPRTKSKGVLVSSVSDPSLNPHSAGDNLSFQDINNPLLKRKVKSPEKLNRHISEHPHYYHRKKPSHYLEPLPKPSDSEDWSVKLYKKKINPARSGVLGHAIRSDMVPEPLLIDPSKDQLILTHYGLGDKRAGRLANSLKAYPMLRHIDIRGNRLTQRSLSAILEVLKEIGEQGNSVLECLDISKNKLGMLGAKGIARLFTTKPSVPLVKLSLSHVGLLDNQAEELVRALIHEGKTVGAPALRSLDLSHNQISSRGGVAIGELLELDDHESLIEELDLSWNFLRGTGANRIGSALADDEALKKLNLAYNTFGKSGALALGRALETNDSLSWLNMTQNNVTGKAAIVLALGLEFNEALEHLILDGNPIGEAGARAMLRLYANGEEDTTLYMAGCNTSLGGKGHVAEEDNDSDGELEDAIISTSKSPLNNADADDDNVFIVGPTFVDVVRSIDGFEPNDPTGTYILDMDKPYERAIAHLILDLANRIPGFELGEQVEYQSSDGGMKIINVQRPEYEDLNVARAKIIDRATGSAWEIPPTGILTVKVIKQWHAPCPCQGITDPALARMIQVMYGAPNANERMQMLRLAVKDMYFEGKQALTILSHLHSFDELSIATGILLPVLLDGRKEFLASVDHAMLKPVQRSLGALFHFRPWNPTGRYFLNLNKEHDRTLMKKLLELNTMHKEYAIRHSKHGDTSKHGDWSNFRNCVFNDKSVNVEILCRNSIPTRGDLTVDYVCPKRAPKDAVPLDEAALDKHLEVLNFSVTAAYPDARVDDYFMPLAPPAKGSHSKLGNVRKKIRGLRGLGIQGVSAKANAHDYDNVDGKEEDDDFEGGDEDANRSPRSIGPDERLAARIKRSRELSVLGMDHKALSLVEKMHSLHDITCHNYLTVEQLIRIVKSIPAQFPTARVAAVQSAFSRLVDLENFWKIEDAMDDEYRIQVVMLEERLGVLNIVNPNYVDRPYMMYLTIEEHHKLANMLVRLAIDEPGENWCNQTYQRQLFLPPIPGWQLSESFIQDVPREGLLCLHYYSGSDQKCAPNWDTRRELMSKFLVGDGERCRILKFDHEDLDFMHLHKPRDIVIGGKDHDKVSALRSRNEKLLAARAKFESKSCTWHLF